MSEQIEGQIRRRIEQLERDKRQAYKSLIMLVAESRTPLLQNEVDNIKECLNAYNIEISTLNWVLDKLEG